MDHRHPSICQRTGHQIFIFSCTPSNKKTAKCECYFIISSSSIFSDQGYHGPAFFFWPTRPRLMNSQVLDKVSTMRVQVSTPRSKCRSCVLSRSVNWCFCRANAICVLWDEPINIWIGNDLCWCLKLSDINRRCLEAPPLTHILHVLGARAVCLT